MSVLTASSAPLSRKVESLCLARVQPTTKYRNFVLSVPLIRLGFEMDLLETHPPYWPRITYECYNRLDLLFCIPSSSLIVEYDLVQILVQLDNLRDVPLAIVCKFWHAACAES